MQVNITKRIDTPEGKRYCPVVICPNGRIKPDGVMMNDRQEPLNVNRIEIGSFPNRLHGFKRMHHRVFRRTTHRTIAGKTAKEPLQSSMTTNTANKAISALIRHKPHHSSSTLSHPMFLLHQPVGSRSLIGVAAFS
jgi:hypothetical protein